MKKRLIWLTVIAVIITALTIGIVAATEEPKITVKYGNIGYTNAEITLDYAVKFEGVPEDAERGLLIWQGAPAKYYLKGREDVILSPKSEVEINGDTYTVFSLDGISEKEIVDDVYAVAYARIGTRVIYSEINKHSPLRYAYIADGKIGNSPVEDEKILAFLDEMIANGAKAQNEAGYKIDTLADSSFVELSLANGKFADGTTRALLKAGGLVAVIADESPTDFVSGWVDENGSDVSADGLEYIRVPEKNGTVTATYVKATTGLEFDLCANDAKFLTTPPTSYKIGEVTVLPEPVREGYCFAGWYTSPDCATKSALSVISANMKGDLKLYANWSKKLYSEDYSKLTGINVTDENNSYTTPLGSVFRNVNKDGTTHKYSANGIVWHNGTYRSDIMLTTKGGLAGLMGDDMVVTIRMRLSCPEGANPFAFSANMRVSYKNETIGLIRVNNDGGIFLGSDHTYRIGTLTSTPQNVTICVDFAEGMLIACNDAGELLQSIPFSIPSSSQHKTYEDWKNDLKSFMVHLIAEGNDDANNGVAIGALEIYSGNLALRNLEAAKSTTELEARIAELIAENALFDKTTFESPYTNYKATSNTSMPEPVYDVAPALYARDNGTGARLMLNSSMITGLIATLEDEQYSKSYDALLSMANSNVDGKLGTPSLNYNGRKGLHNFSNSVLATIEAKAFMYRVMFEQGFEEGSAEALQRDIYGYEAIIAIKNFLETMHIEYINSDQCREYGYLMFVTAEVYDWCYPLLDADDKQQLKYAVVARCLTGTSGSTDNNFTTYNGIKMEMGFPPSAKGSVVGHNSEAQILRDYLSFALAIYDEDPTWWEYVAGRIVGDYVEVRNIYFLSDIPQQGVSGYAQHRHYSDLYSAWIIQTATGINPYTEMDRTIHSIIGSMTPNATNLYGAGDGSMYPKLTSVANHALISAAIYNDDTLFTWAYNMKNGFNVASASGTTTVTIANMFIFMSQGMELVEDEYEDLDLIQYNGYPLGQIISRSEWENTNAASTYMKLGIITTSNHEHRDTGTFQIYYKGLLTADSGKYDNYGHEHTQQYHHQTVAHNGLLIFNPAKWNYNSSTAETKWYTGGQRKPGGNNDLDSWMQDKFIMSELMGAQYGYKDEAERKADYAYIAGDITRAYDSSTASYVTRSMLTVYTENPDFPMYFFVFDSIESVDKSYKKTFVLHVTGEAEPTVDGKVVVTTNGEGKLVSHTLTSGAKIEAIGGVTYTNGKYDYANSRNYLINGHQLIPLNAGHDGNWGRIEISVTGSKKNTFMHAMYVTDKDGTAKAPNVTKINGDGLEGALIGNVAAVFLDSTKRTLNKVAFTSGGSGEIKYYVAGLFEGEWKITVDGKKYGTTKAGEGGMAVFTAPAGDVELIPGDDIMPEGGGHIYYELGGGELPEGAPTAFKKGGGVVLPIPTFGHSEFDGWYTTPDFAEGTRITKIPSNAVGEFTVYAKWKLVFVKEDFENTSIKLSTVGKTEHIGNLDLAIVTGSGSVQTKIDGDTELKYLAIVPAGGEITLKTGGYASINSASFNKITYTVELATSAKGKSPRANFILRGASSSHSIFSINVDGSLMVNAHKIAMLTTTPTKYSFTVDFSTSTISVYDADNNLIKDVKVSYIDKSVLGNALFEMSITDGKIGASKYTLKLGEINVRTAE